MLNSKARTIVLLLVFYFFGYLIFSWFIDWEWMPPTTHDPQLLKKRPDGPLIFNDDFISGAELGGGRLVPSPIAERQAHDVAGTSIRNVVEGVFNKKLDIPLASKMKLFKNKAKEIHQKLSSSKNFNKTSNDFVLFTIINSAYLNLTLNWLCNVHALSEKKNSSCSHIHQAVLIVALDEKICKQIHFSWPQVICISNSVDSRFNEALTSRQQSYAQLLLYRTHFLAGLAEERIPFVMFEPDSVWLRDPREELFNAQGVAENADLVLPVKYNVPNAERFTIDTMLAFATDATRRAMQELKRTLTCSLEDSDKNVINRLCSTQYMALVCREFQWTEVADGKWLKMSEGERRAGGLRPFIVNNNMYVGAKNKAARQSLASLWFLSAAKNTCNTKKATLMIAKHTNT